MGAYISITFANNVLDNDPHVGSAWLKLTDDQKESLIYSAERFIDEEKWLGTKTEAMQTNAFPRTMLFDARHSDFWCDATEQRKNDVKSAENVIPEQIKQGVCDVIIDVLRKKTFDKLVALKEIGVTSMEAGTTAFDFADPSWKKRLPKEAYNRTKALRWSFWYNQENKLSRI